MSIAVFWRVLFMVAMQTRVVLSVFAFAAAGLFAFAVDSSPPNSAPYEAATKLVLKGLISPATARFSSLGKDEEAKLEKVGPDAWDASGFVDSQNVFGALLRQEWRIIWKQSGNAIVPLYFKLGTDEAGIGVEEALLMALPREQQDAIATAAKEKAAMEDRKTQESADARRSIERRDYFRQAREFIVGWAKLPETIRHSTLGENDDEFTVCHVIGNDVWEARGVIGQTVKNGTTRTDWRVLFWVKDDGNTHAGYWEFGTQSDGELEGTLRRAGVATDKQGWHTPTPPYPPAALVSRTTGQGTAQIITNGDGKVISCAVKGLPPILETNTRTFANANWKGPPNASRSVPVIYRIP